MARPPGVELAEMSDGLLDDLAPAPYRAHQAPVRMDLAAFPPYRVPKIHGPPRHLRAQPPRITAGGKTPRSALHRVFDLRPPYNPGFTPHPPPNINFRGPNCGSSASPRIADPFRKEDCCLISDGGGAYVMTSAERARDLRKPAVTVNGVGLGNSRTRVHWAEQGDFTATPQVFAAPVAFAIAGIERSDVDVLTCYDPFTIVSLMQIEDIGFCPKGDGGRFVAGTTLNFDGGVLPYNTHGGMVSHAYVLGIAHVVEVVRQLRGESAAQAPDASVAIYGGYTGPQAATLILTRSDA